MITYGFTNVFLDNEYQMRCRKFGTISKYTLHNVHGIVYRVDYNAMYIVLYTVQ